MLTSRRGFLSGSASVVAIGLLPVSFARAASDEAVAAAIRELIGTREVIEGGLDLKLPGIAENGASVPLTASVESPMSEDDHVRAIHVVATRNPTPGVVSFRLTPASGRAEVSTRIRLAEEQTVVALAEMSDGRVLRASAEVAVSIGGCAT